DPKVVDHEGNTLLHIAAASPLTRSIVGKSNPDAEALTKWLMSLPLDAATKNKAGKTALELAQQNKEGAKELELALLARTTAPGPEVRLYLADQPVKLQTLYSPMADDEPMPSPAEFLLLRRAHQRRALDQSASRPPLPIGVSRRRSLEDAKANIVHPSAGSAVVPTKELVTQVNLEEVSPPAFDPLFPGDILQLPDGPSDLAAQFQKKLDIRVTVSVQGVDRQFQIGESNPWHPLAPELPGGLWDQTLAPLFAGIHDVDAKQVKLIRTLHGKRLERTIDLTSVAPTAWPRILSGDRIELVQRTRDPSNQPPSAVVVTMPDLAFSHSVKVAGTEAPSLVVGVAMLSMSGEPKPPVDSLHAIAFFARGTVWREGIGPLGRDWSRVTLWRAGKDAPEIFDLASATAKLDLDSGSSMLRDAEPQIQAGDRIELPPKKGNEGEPMSKEIFNYIQRSMLPQGVPVPKR
ncbi:MAG TPA: hypothetical protein VD994_02135, partial [Prosthecobacter sp.]|nr:hypothetical protein [Prosthecobacter sp.]